MRGRSDVPGALDDVLEAEGLRLLGRLRLRRWWFWRLGGWLLGLGRGRKSGGRDGHSSDDRTAGHYTHGGFYQCTVEQVGMSSHEVMGFSDGGKRLRQRVIGERWGERWDAGCRTDVQQG
jgi:hypothetical protein